MKHCVTFCAIGGKLWAVDPKSDSETQFIVTVKNTIAALFGLTKQTCINLDGSHN
jgi:hypothetical protein